MMKSIRLTGFFAATAAAVILLTGCEKENENTVDNRPVKARITSTIDGMATRAAGTAWAPGDRIGVYADNTEGANFLTNAPYITTAGDGVFTAGGEEFYFQDEHAVTFSAYYPFEGTDGRFPGENGASTIISKTITADDQTPATQPKIDYLYAGRIAASSTAPNVKFQFNHCMSRIVLKFLPGDGITTLDDIEYTLDGILLAGTFNTYFGGAKADANTAAAPLTMSVLGNAVTELTSSLIFFPQQSSEEKTLKLNMRGTTYTATFIFKKNADAMGELAAGHTYTYNVKINNTTMTIDPATVNPWEDGGSDDINSTPI